MSNKDVKKGIALQAEADAEKIEKLSKGLTAHKAVLKSLESGQGEIREAMGILLDDMSASESNKLFDLQIRKTPGELDDTEMRVLCACLYTLLSKTGQDSPSQITFYSNLEKYLGIAERKDDFDFFTLSNIDSHTDRLVILKAVCSFLYLNSESFSFLREKDDFSWLYAFAPIKDIADVCSAINSEHAVLGVNGILGNYDPMLAPKEDKIRTAEEAWRKAEEARKAVLAAVKSAAGKTKINIDDMFSEDYNAAHLARQPILTYQQVENQFGIQITGFGRGINPTPTKVVLISSIGKSGGKFVYHDKWNDEGDYIYSGEGKSGDQTMTKGNLAIKNAASDGREIHLFVKFSPRDYYYQGVYELVDYIYEDEQDENGHTRKEYKFQLRKVLL